MTTKDILTAIQNGFDPKLIEHDSYISLISQLEYNITILYKVLDIFIITFKITMLLIWRARVGYPQT